MKLSYLLKDIDFRLISGDPDGEVTGIAYDSRTCRPGDLFVCKGVQGDGHAYADDAYRHGARAFLAEKSLTVYHNDATYFETPDTKSALSRISRTFFGYPDERLHTIAVTGTKGKTTTTYLIRRILENTGVHCGIIGTIYNITVNSKTEADRTTPEGYDIQKLLDQMYSEGAKAAAMEVSSHALCLGRVDGIQFNTGIFTNLSQDHLDFHKDMEDYFNAKMKLFEQTDVSIVNIDDEYGKRAYDYLRISGKEPLSVSLHDPNAMVYAYDIQETASCTSFKTSITGNTVISTGMHGSHNIYNTCFAIASAHVYGVDPEMLSDCLLDVTVPGRQERYPNKRGDMILIDYAHSPGSMKEVLQTYNRLKKGRLVVVFGAGGDRDHTKRPLMGKIAGELADFTIITSDNPRTEKPEEIIAEIEAGIKPLSGAKYITICNRKEAIRYAVLNAKKDDIIILAGKGHETYQEINHVKHHMDEREILAEVYGETND